MNSGELKKGDPVKAAAYYESAMESEDWKVLALVMLQKIKTKLP